MGNQLHLTFFFLFLSVITTGPGAYAHPGFNKLLVFGDSYVDAGNWKSGTPWEEPYGITDPGEPDGKFSDGRVFSDFIAEWMEIAPATPYELVRKAPFIIDEGINFAYGGTGVFDTMNSEPNMTAQISLFEELLKTKIIDPKQYLNSSVALVSVSGSDYNAYFSKGGSDVAPYVKSVVDQLQSNLKRLHELGVQKIVVMGLQPLGCLPQFTKPYFYVKCNDTVELVSAAHNMWLTNFTSGEPAFVMLEMYDAFVSAMTKHQEERGSLDAKDTLTPCCAGITSQYFCGDVENGEKKYTVCSDPKSSFFWDSFNPTQAGWSAIYSALKSSTVDPFERELWGSF